MRDSVFPELGMKYKDVRKRVKRIAHDYRTNPDSDKEMQINLTRSLINQARLHEGNDVVDELHNELEYNKSSFSGASNKQIGFGPGKRLGAGKWRLVDGKWQRS